MVGPGRGGPRTRVCCSNIKNKTFFSGKYVRFFSYSDIGPGVCTHACIIYILVNIAKSKRCRRRRDELAAYLHTHKVYEKKGHARLLFGVYGQVNFSIFHRDRYVYIYVYRHALVSACFRKVIL